MPNHGDATVLHPSENDGGPVGASQTQLGAEFFGCDVDATFFDLYRPHFTFPQVAAQVFHCVRKHIGDLVGPPEADAVGQRDMVAIGGEIGDVWVK